MGDVCFSPLLACRASPSTERVRRDAVSTEMMLYAEGDDAVRGDAVSPHPCAGGVSALPLQWTWWHSHTGLPGSMCSIRCPPDTICCSSEHQGKQETDSEFLHSYAAHPSYSTGSPTHILD